MGRWAIDRGQRGLFYMYAGIIVDGRMNGRLVRRRASLFGANVCMCVWDYGGCVNNLSSLCMAERDGLKEIFLSRT